MLVYEKTLKGEPKYMVGRAHKFKIMIALRVKIVCFYTKCFEIETSYILNHQKLHTFRQSFRLNHDRTLDALL